MIGELILAFFGGLFAAGIGVATGSGGVISVSLLVMMGLPLPSAIASNRTAGFGGAFSALYQYSKSKKTDWSLAIKLVPLAAVAGWIGSTLLGILDTGVIRIIFMALIVLTIIFSIAKPKIGLTEIRRSRLMRIAGFIVYFLVDIFAGLIGAGIGTLFIFILSFFFGKTVVVSQATNMLAWLVLSTVATIVSLQNNLVNIPLASAMFCGMSIGGYFGARMAILKGNKFVKNLMLIMLIAVLIQLFFTD